MLKRARSSIYKGFFNKKINYFNGLRSVYESVDFVFTFGQRKFDQCILD